MLSIVPKRKKAQEPENANSLSFKIWLVSFMQHNC